MGALVFVEGVAAAFRSLRPTAAVVALFRPSGKNKPLPFAPPAVTMAVTCGCKCANVREENMKVLAEQSMLLGLHPSLGQGQHCPVQLPKPGQPEIVRIPPQ